MNTNQNELADEQDFFVSWTTAIMCLASLAVLAAFVKVIGI